MNWKTLLALVAALALSGCIQKIPTTTTTTTTTTTSSTTSTTLKVVETEKLPPTPGGQWHYSKDADSMGNGTVIHAFVQSTNSVNFDFPYHGEQNGLLGLREHPRLGKDILFSMEKGQFICSSYRGCMVLVRFDDGQAEKFTAIGPSDNSSNQLFIHNYKKFTEKMQRSKRVRIAAEVYREGVQIFEFDVIGFSLNKFKG